MSHYLIEQIAARANIEVRTGSSATAAEADDGRLRWLRVQGPEGEETLDVDACFVFIGASPRTDWLEGVLARDERGFTLAYRPAHRRGPPRRLAHLRRPTRPHRLPRAAALPRA
jgi:thioredoxin reductase (NADPH)